MAKINDLKRAVALDSCRSVRDKKDHYLPWFDSRVFSSLSIKFGQENRKGIGFVKVTIGIYFDSMLKITFDGWYDHVENDATFKCVTIEEEFKPAHLYSINNDKFEGLWLEGEEGDAAAVPVTASVAEALDCEVKRYSAVK